jgi:hypothetical protein
MSACGSSRATLTRASSRSIARWPGATSLLDVQDGELHVRRLPGAKRSDTTSHIASRLPQVDLADILIDFDV